MVNYWKLVNMVIDKSDVLLFVLDARFPEETRNREIERKLKFKEKRFIYVLNKSDLISKEEMERVSSDIQPSVFVSSRDRLGATKLFKKILEVAHGGRPVVGVIGYPNVGKSSIINLLKGKRSARVSSHAGLTRGVQTVNARGKVRLIDTPGVLANQENDPFKQLIIGSANAYKFDHPEIFAMKLMERFPERIEKFYGLTFPRDDMEKALEEISKKKNVLIKGGHADVKRMSIQMLYDWQTGKMHEKELGGRMSERRPKKAKEPVPKDTDGKDLRRPKEDGKKDTE